MALKAVAAAGCVVWMAVGWPAPAAAEYRAKGKRDPFVPLVTAEGQRFHPPGVDEEEVSGAANVTLQGIVYDPAAESYAIVNGQVVHEQDLVDGMVVLRIQPTTVTMLVDNQPRELTVAPAEDKGITP